MHACSFQFLKRVSRHSHEGTRCASDLAGPAAHGPGRAGRVALTMLLGPREQWEALDAEVRSSAPHRDALRAHVGPAHP
jgi:hypothetical protein